MGKQKKTLTPIQGKATGTHQMVTPPLKHKQVLKKTVYARMLSILERYPEARDDYRIAMIHYWMEFDGLNDAILGNLDRFTAWFALDATSPKTLQNRAFDVQRAHPELDSTPEVRSWRDRQGAKGMVNRVTD